MFLSGAFAPWPRDLSRVVSQQNEQLNKSFPECARRTVAFVRERAQYLHGCFVHAYRAWGRVRKTSAVKSARSLPTSKKLWVRPCCMVQV